MLISCRDFIRGPLFIATSLLAATGEAYDTPATRDRVQEVTREARQELDSFVKIPKNTGN